MEGLSEEFMWETQSIRERSPLLRSNGLITNKAVPDWYMPSGNNLIFSVFLAGICQPGITSFLRYSGLAYAIREWRSLAYIRD